jgi:hypothetical protein
MKTCQVCGKPFDAPTCPNDGEASWAEPKPVKPPPTPAQKKAS